MIKAIKKFIKAREYKQRTKLQDVARCIANFYVGKQPDISQASHDLATHEILSLGITKLEMNGNEVSITLTRPGLLIGRRGTNIDALRDHMSVYYNRKMRIKVKEELILQCLIPYYPDDQDFD